MLSKEQIEELRDVIARIDVERDVIARQEGGEGTRGNPHKYHNPPTLISANFEI